MLLYLYRKRNHKKKEGKVNEKLKFLPFSTFRQGKENVDTKKLITNDITTINHDRYRE